MFGKDLQTGFGLSISIKNFNEILTCSCDATFF